MYNNLFNRNYRKKEQPQSQLVGNECVDAPNMETQQPVMDDSHPHNTPTKHEARKEPQVPLVSCHLIQHSSQPRKTSVSIREPQILSTIHHLTSQH